MLAATDKTLRFFAYPLPFGGYMRFVTDDSSVLRMNYVETLDKFYHPEPAPEKLPHSDLDEEDEKDMLHTLDAAIEGAPIIAEGSVIEINDGPAPLTPPAVELSGRDIDNKAKIAELRERMHATPLHPPTELSAHVYKQLDAYFNGKLKTLQIPCKLYGTTFQKKVWARVSAIPYGQTSTYWHIASALRNSRASRAVGHALNANPLMLIIPCHRVVKINGELGGYVGGEELKNTLLRLEAGHKLGWPYAEAARQHRAPRGGKSGFDSKLFV